MGTRLLKEVQMLFFNTGLICARLMWPHPVLQKREGGACNFHLLHMQEFHLLYVV